MTKCYRHPHHESSRSCGLCNQDFCEECAGFFGLCRHCCYKILIVIVVVMVIASYTAWMTVFV